MSTYPHRKKINRAAPDLIILAETFFFTYDYVIKVKIYCHYQWGITQ